MSVDAHMNTTQGLGSGRWHCQSSRRLNSCKKPAPSPEERHSASRRRAPVPRAPALAVVAGAATRALRPHPPRDPRPAPVRRIDLMFTRRRRRGGAAGGAERLRPAALTMVSRGLGCSEAPARCTGHRLQHRQTLAPDRGFLFRRVAPIGQTCDWHGRRRGSQTMERAPGAARGVAVGARGANWRQIAPTSRQRPPRR